MSVRSRVIGRRAVAAIVSVGLATGAAVTAPTAVLPTALAAPSSAPAPGELSVANPEVAAGSSITVTGTGFAPRTEGQSLAVDLLQKQGTTKTRFTLPSTTEGSTFDAMDHRGDSDIYFGIISSLDHLPNATNGGNFTFDVRIPESTAPGNYVLAVKGGSYGENAPAVVKLVRITVTAPEMKKSTVKAFFGRPDAPNIEDTIRGTSVTGTFTGLPEGSRVTAVGVLDGDTIANSWLPSGEFVANADGEVVVPGIAIPADAPLGAALSATFTTPDGHVLSATARRNGITPNVGEMNADKIQVLAQHSTPGGLYQSSYDAAANKLFVTYTNFYAKSSGILAADPTTLDYTDLVSLVAPPEGTTPAVDPATQAIFGITVDAKHNTLWTTNTKGPSVSVYSAEGTKLATLPLTNMVDGTNKAHPRDVVINPTTGLAYVSDAAGPGGKIFVFDTNNYADGTGPIKTISIPEFGDRGPLELKLDQKAQTLWTVGFNGRYLAKVDLKDGADTVTAYDLGNADVHGNRGAGLAIDTKRGKVYAASQEPSHVKVFDIKTEKVVATIVTGASPLDAIYDPVKDVVYVTNRLSGTVNVIDPDTYTILATRDVAPYPNQFSTDGKGTVYLTTKAFLGRWPVGSKYKTDTLYALTFDKGEASTPGEQDEPGNGSSNPLDPKDKDKDKDGTAGSIPAGGSSTPKDKDKDKDGSNGHQSDPKDQDHKDKGSSEASGSLEENGALIGIGAVLALVLGALGFAVQSGVIKLPAGFPSLPGLPK